MSIYDTQIRKSIPLSTPDFDKIKDSLKTYLKGQEIFTDYDFEGSVMSTILDLLSYNTHFQAFYLNMVGNESFLSTAVKRDSVVARAKDLDYLPRSAICASATLFIEMISPIGAPFIDIPKGTMFTSSAQGSTYYFRTMDTRRVLRNSLGTYTASDIEIVEGKQFSHVFSVGEDEIKGGVIIPNPNVDITRLRVYVRENTTTSSFEEFVLFDDITDQTPDDKVYYLSEVEGGLINVYFGDGIVSKPLLFNGEVRIEYMISSGEAPNSIGAFSLSSPIPGSSQTTLEVVSAATGGALAESIESIKFRAPKSFEAQNRAVVADDYKEILRLRYPNIQDIIVWGGEDNNPPQYGKVFISIKPITGFFITDAEKEKVQTILKKYNVVTVKPVVLDADYVFVTVKTVVDYDGTQTDKTEGEIQDLVYKSVMSYNDYTLSKFDSDLRFSVLSRTIDASDPSIISNTSSVKLSKRVYAESGIPQALNISFNNSLNKGTVSSSYFKFNGFNNCFIDESSISGKLNISTYMGTTKIIVSPNFADINYQTGTITANAITFDEIPSTYVDEVTMESYIKIFAAPTAIDIFAAQRQIIEIDEIQISTNRLL